MLKGRSAAAPSFVIANTRISQSPWSPANTVTLTIESLIGWSKVFAGATIAVRGTIGRLWASKQKRALLARRAHGEPRRAAPRLADWLRRTRC